MTKRKKRSPFPLPEPADYDVGYGKPPKGSQYPPGRSGNQRGRPKGAKNKTPGPSAEGLKNIVLKEFYRPVQIQEKGEPPKATAIWV